MTLISNDFIQIIKNWRLIHLLGVSNLRIRYSRSKLGQLWLTLALLIQITATGIVWSVLWHLPIKQFLPYVAIGQTIYQVLFLTLQDSAYVFINDSRLYINQRLPFMTSILSNIYKNLIIFTHNLPIIILAILISEQHAIISLQLFIMLPIIFIFLFCTTYFLACLCTRYRDLIHIVTMLLNISFLITPILWKLSYIPQKFQCYFFINPLTAFLEILRNPLLNMSINGLAYISVIIWVCIAVFAMIFMYYRFERRIILWI